MKFDRFLRLLPLMLFSLCLFGLTHPALAQGANDVTLGVTATSTAPGQAIPTLTWSSTNPAPTSCMASGNSLAWTGVKSPGGSVVLPAIKTNANYVLACTWPADTTATVSWTAPTLNTDGTPLTDLAGFKVWWGLGDPSMVTSGTPRVISSPTTLSTVITNLPVGTWYFTVTSCNAAGVCSDVSNIPSKVIGTSVTVTKSASVLFPGTAVVTVK